jgi:hypothetical protein
MTGEQSVCVFLTCPLVAHFSTRGIYCFPFSSLY